MSTESTQDQVLSHPAASDVAGEKNAIEETVQIDSMQANLVRRIVLSVVSFALAIALLIWGVHASGTQDPYISSVLQLTGDASRGREIFITNCATCHGLEADGEVGPDLRNVSERKSRAALIEQVISGQTPPMPQFQPNERDMADLLSFLETL